MLSWHLCPFLRPSSCLCVGSLAADSPLSPTVTTHFPNTHTHAHTRSCFHLDISFQYPLPPAMVPSYSCRRLCPSENLRFWQYSSPQYSFSPDFLESSLFFEICMFHRTLWFYFFVSKKFKKMETDNGEWRHILALNRIFLKLNYLKYVWLAAEGVSFLRVVGAGAGGDGGWVLWSHCGLGPASCLDSHRVTSMKMIWRLCLRLSHPLSYTSAPVYLRCVFPSSRSLGGWLFKFSLTFIVVTNTQR